MLAIAHGLLAAAEIGMKEHDRLVLARTLFERRLEGRRTSSKLPELVELVMAKRKRCFNRTLTKRLGRSEHSYWA